MSDSELSGPALTPWGKKIIEANEKLRAENKEILAAGGFLWELRRANLSRVKYFGHGGIEEGWSIAEWGCALGGEAGELLNVLKKIHRGAEFDPSKAELKQMAGEEIADVIIYIDLIAAKLDIDLISVIRHKFNKTSERAGFSQRL